MRKTVVHYFSCSLFTEKAPSQMFQFFLNTPLKPLTIFAIGSILMLDWVLDTSLACLKKDKNSEKPVKELFLETLQQRLRNFWEKLYWEMIIFKVVFSKFCKKSRSAHQSCSINKGVLNNFAIFTGNTCVGVSFWKSCRLSGLQLY